MGEENNLEKSMIFSGMVSAPAFQPTVIAEPISGVKLYDGLCLNEFGPELTWSHSVTTEPIGTVKDVLKTEGSFVCTVEPIDMKAYRRIFGLPEVPLSKVKHRRKTFKKALMAYGYSRNRTEAIISHMESLTKLYGFGYSWYMEHVLYSISGDISTKKKKG